MANNVILFDGDAHQSLKPLTYTRPVGEIRCGIFTIAEKWRRLARAEVSFLTQSYLAEKYPTRISNANLFVAAHLLPNPRFVEEALSLPLNSKLMLMGKLVAAHLDHDNAKFAAEANEIPSLEGIASQSDYGGTLSQLQHCASIFELNGQEIEKDFKLLHIPKNPDSRITHSTIIGDQLFVDEEAYITGATINTETGPVCIGKRAEVQEGSVIRGPFVLDEGSVVKMGAKIYGPTTVGPHCKVGGELNNVVFQGYSNKAHDGFLGNSVIGSWCNLGADTNSSNLKNDYGNIKLWNYETQRLTDSGRMFCGLIMGDHAKSGINTMFNTGTTVGVFANIFGGGFPEKYVPSFTWGGTDESEEYRIEKALRVAERVARRRNITLTETDKNILKHIFELTKPYRAAVAN